MDCFCLEKKLWASNSSAGHWGMKESLQACHPRQNPAGIRWGAVSLCQQEVGCWMLEAGCKMLDVGTGGWTHLKPRHAPAQWHMVQHGRNCESMLKMVLTWTRERYSPSLLSDRPLGYSAQGLSREDPGSSALVLHSHALYSHPAALSAQPLLSPCPAVGLCAVATCPVYSGVVRAALWSGLLPDPNMTDSGEHSVDLGQRAASW